MHDPLELFDWNSLHARYDRLCGPIDRYPQHLAALGQAPKCDRKLYYELVHKLKPGADPPPRRIDVGWWEAILYWKLYSGRWVGNVRHYVPSEAVDRRAVQREIDKLCNALPAQIDVSWEATRQVIRAIDGTNLRGMKSNNAYPMRTTFLHFIYPDVVPIFDVQVLKAVGVHEENANHSIVRLEQYILHVWRLKEKYSAALLNLPETRVRAIEMALWVMGHGSDPGRGGSCDN
ncbi:MAG: hypothetical protein V1790_02040 [Planctomycetota bacterium]